MLASRTDRSPRRRWRLPGASREVRREPERNLELLGTDCARQELVSRREGYPFFRGMQAAEDFSTLVHEIAHLCGPGGLCGARLWMRVKTRRHARPSAT